MDIVTSGKQISWDMWFFPKFPIYDVHHALKICGETLKEHKIKFIKQINKRKFIGLMKFSELS